MEENEMMQESELESVFEEAFGEENGDAADFGAAEEDTKPSGTPEEATEGAQEQPAQDAGTEKEEPRYKIKFEGQERELPLSELLAAAQKGLHYDQVRSERDALRASPEAAIIGELAQEANMSREEYLGYLRSWRQNQAVLAQVSKGVPEETARELVALKASEENRKAQEVKARAQQQRQEQFAALAREYPDLKELPAEVVEAIRGGETPLHAYRAFENRQLRQQVAAMEQNRKNRQMAAPSAYSEAPAAARDPFEEGFDSIFSA